MIKGNEDHFPVGMMCRMLSVSRSGYYGWKNRPLSCREQANQKLVVEIKRVFDDEKGRPESLGGFKKKANRPADTVLLD
ncbi:MAG: hypothetical protein ACXV8O_12760 [Methylobacter sp.]